MIANLKKRYSVKDLDKMVWRCASAETVDNYDHAIQNLEEAYPEARAELTEGMSPDQWALAYDGNLSFGKHMINSSESVNSLLKRARKLLVQALASAIFYRMNELFVHRRDKATQVVMADTPLLYDQDSERSEAIWHGELGCVRNVVERVNRREALYPSSADPYLMEIGHYC
ncbi:hypothetical protein H6P81_006673 [Aristolochia fimbriata]|uniref:Uncharacterized protein n=1 Tax=Aristolochia fimbriata TaxID=158543 RepID=A0AAV7EZ48_ARIFI|nr:hypothetical protein H6P81_006673 [Aristolochia fimbriata]